jgi:hypothetical protein
MRHSVGKALTHELSTPRMNDVGFQAILAGKLAMFAGHVNEQENAFIAAHTWQNPCGCQENALTLALHMCQIRLSRGGSLFQVFQVC